MDASEIEVRLGATWIAPEYIQQFMHETFQTPMTQRENIQIVFVKATAAWFITHKSWISDRDITARTTYGTDRCNAYEILEETLNLRDVRVYDTVTDPDGKERRVINSKQTTLAAQKQQAIKDAFKDWLWRDPDRRQTLVKLYNETMNCIAIYVLTAEPMLAPMSPTQRRRLDCWRTGLCGKVKSYVMRSLTLCGKARNIPAIIGVVHTVGLQVKWEYLLRIAISGISISISLY